MQSLLSGILLFICFYANAGQADETVQDLKSTFPEEVVAVELSESTFVFSKGTAGNPYSVIEETSDRFVALRPSVETVDVHFYEIYSSISRQKVTGTGQFNAYSDQRCGDYERDGIFYHDAKLCEFRLRFKNKGEFLTVTTTRNYTDLKYFNLIPLSKIQAVKNRKVRLEIPAGIDLDIVEMNFNGFAIVKSESTNEKDVRIVEYTISNVPSVLKLDNSPGYACSSPYLLILVKSYMYYDNKVTVLESQHDLYKWYHSLVVEDAIGPELKALAGRLTEKAVTDDERIASVYHWIQDKIRYITFENGTAAYVPENPDKVFKNKYGDCKGMSNLLKSMLRYLGYDARLTWVYSGNLCYPEGIASLVIHNHMICAVKFEEGFRYLDPTATYTPLYVIPEHIQGKQCMISNGEAWESHRIPAVKFSDNLYSVKSTIKAEGNQLIVNGHMQIKGESKSMFQYFLNHTRSDKKEDLLDYFVKGVNNNFTVEEITTTPMDSITSCFDVRYVMRVANSMIDLGDEILLTLDFNNEYRDAKIDSGRIFNFDTGGRRLFKHNITFNLPPNLMVKHLPAPVNCRGSGFEFTAGYTVDGPTLVYNKQLAVDADILHPGEFGIWNEAIRLLSAFYNEMLILGKKID